jgi:hypothetical protein
MLAKFMGPGINQFETLVSLDSDLEELTPDRIKEILSGKLVLNCKWNRLQLEHLNLPNDLVRWIDRPVFGGLIPDFPGVELADS